MSYHFAPAASGLIPVSMLVPAATIQPKAPAARRRHASSANGASANTFETSTSSSRTTPPLPLWAIKLEQSAQRIRDLRPGWDGPDSGVVTEDTIQRAVALCRTALSGLKDPAAPYLVPAGDGSLQIEWHRVHGELEFCLEPDGSCDLWGRDHRTGQEFGAEGSRALALFRTHARWVAERPADAAYVSPETVQEVFELAA